MGIIFKHINSQWQEGGKPLSVSTADRIKHNELKLQQEKVREDIRINFLGEQERLYPVSITTCRWGQLRQTYIMGGRSAGGWSCQCDVAHSNHHHVQLWEICHKRASTRKQHNKETVYRAQASWLFTPASHLCRGSLSKALYVFMFNLSTGETRFFSPKPYFSTITHTEIS